LGDTKQPTTGFSSNLKTGTKTGGKSGELMADAILPMRRIKLSKEYTDFLRAMTREESAWVHYWSKIYYDLVSAPEAAPWETLEFVNCVLKGALFDYNNAAMKAIEILRYFGVENTIKFSPKPRSRDLSLLQCSL
jgi:hypothetical protein